MIRTFLSPVTVIVISFIYSAYLWYNFGVIKHTNTIVGEDAYMFFAAIAVFFMLALSLLYIRDMKITSNGKTKLAFGVALGILLLCVSLLAGYECIVNPQSQRLGNVIHLCTSPLMGIINFFMFAMQAGGLPLILFAIFCKIYFSIFKTGNVKN